MYRAGVMSADTFGRVPPRLGGGRFQIVEQIGDGGTATVYLAWDDQDKLWCAVKALHHKHLSDPETRRRFSQEAEALERLRHPNVPRLILHEPYGTPPFMAMELARCGSTMDWVRDHGPMPPPMAADVLFQVCEALAEAHACGIVHRDVKPHNFLLDDTGVCKLTDFGIARMSDNTSMTQTGSQIGTFSYMAPEQRSDTKSVDQRADIYSVGASLYTLLTGKANAELFVADKDDALLADVPLPFRNVIIRATRYKPELRYASILEVQSELMNALSRLPPAAHDYPPLICPPAPLADGPPAVLPPGRRFADLERSMALDGTQPTFVSPAERVRVDRIGPAHELVAVKKVMPYYMPPRPTTPSFDDSPSRAIPTYFEDGDRETLVRQQESQELADFVARGQARDVSAPPEDTHRDLADERRVRTLAYVIATAALYLAVLMLILMVGTVRVSAARQSTSVAAERLTDTLRDDGNVVYELGGDRATFEATYQQYIDATDGRERLRAALAFTTALDRVRAEGRPGAASDPKLRRLTEAREQYLESRQVWANLADRFPGNVAVGVGLAPAP